MTLSTPPALTRLKLDYLRSRRDELRAHYARVEEAAASDPQQAYRLLAELRAGAETLHPEAAIAADTCGVDPGGQLTGGSLDLAARLPRELAAGRARSEYAWVFAELVREWAAAHEGPPEESSGEPVAGTAGPVDLGVLDALVRADPKPWQALGEVLAKFDVEAAEYVSAGEVSTLLEELAGGPYRSEPLRHEARRVAKDKELVAEYAGALTLLFDGLERWQWPAEGVPTRVVRAEQRWRRYLDEDLLSLLFLELVGARWCPEVIRGFPSLTESVDDENLLRAALDRGAGQSAFAIPRDWSGGSSHYVRADAVFDERDALGAWFGTVHTRLQGLHALGGRPVHVVVTDIAGFGPSLSHELIARVLEHAGMPARWRALFQRFLAVPVRVEGRSAPTTRGVFPDHRLAMLLAEMVLVAVDLEVYRRSGVAPVRVVDDLVLADDDPGRMVLAWQALQETLTAFGLTLRADKTAGATVFGGAHPTGLPAGKVVIGLLSLRPDGSWAYEDDALAEAREAARRAVEAAPSTLDAVGVFSSRLRECLRKLLPFGIGPGHLGEIGRRMATFYDDLHGPGRSLMSGLRARIAKAVPGCNPEEIPDAVFYWPRTAGGLGLFDAAAQLAPLHSSFRTQAPGSTVPFRRRTPRDDADEERYLEEWKAFLSARDPVPRPRQPEYHLELGARIGDFVLRGRQIYGEEEEEENLRKLRYDLSFYWQWVIAIRGRQLLDAFGTFRFIEAARVPLAALVELGWLGPPG